MEKTSQSLTLEDAEKVVATLNLDTTEWRKWSQRSDSERLALGIIILQKHMRGKSLRTIEAEIGIPHSTCARYKDRALQSIQLPTVEAARKEELDRLDRIIEILWPAVEGGDEKATANYFKASERRSKLLGLDRPMEINQTVVEISAQEMELKALIAQSERDEKLREITLAEDFSKVDQKLPA